MNDYDNDFNNYGKQPNHEINSRYGRVSWDSDGWEHEYDDYSEFASDFLSEPYTSSRNDATSGAVVAGIVGVIAGLVALFNYPYLLGGVAVILGTYAIAKGNKVLGFSAVALGIFSAILPFFFGFSFLAFF